MAKGMLLSRSHAFANVSKAYFSEIDITFDFRMSSAQTGDVLVLKS